MHRGYENSVSVRLASVHQVLRVATIPRGCQHKYMYARRASKLSPKLAMLGNEQEQCVREKRGSGLRLRRGRLVSRQFAAKERQATPPPQHPNFFKSAQDGRIRCGGREPTSRILQRSDTFSPELSRRDCELTPNRKALPS